MPFLICTPLSIWKQKNIQLSSLWVWLISLNMISSSKHITRFCSSWLNITVVYADPISFSLSISCTIPKSNICSVSLFLSVCVHVCIIYVHLCVQVLAGTCGYANMEARGGCQLPSSTAPTVFPWSMVSLQIWSSLSFLLDWQLQPSSCLHPALLHPECQVFMPRKAQNQLVADDGIWT